jgi:hypothetical protein
MEGVGVAGKIITNYKKKLQITSYELQNKNIKEITNYKLRITKQKSCFAKLLILVEFFFTWFYPLYNFLYNINTLANGNSTKVHRINEEIYN